MQSRYILPFLGLCEALTLPDCPSVAVEARKENLVGRASTSPPAFPIQTYVTENFTAPDMAISRSGQTAPGYLFFDPAGAGTTSQAPLIMTDTNELIWHGPSSDPEGENNYQNFRVASLNGEPHLSYWFGFSLATSGHGYGSVAILDSNYHQIYNICVPNTVLKINTGTNLTFTCNHDQHESLITETGTIITSAYNVTPADLSSVGGPRDGWVLSGLFHEIDIKTQEVLFTWNSIDHMDDIPFSRSHQPLNVGNVTVGGNSSATSWDYFHINSIQKQADGGYLVNSRHMFETYKVSANGSIEWRLNGADGGDFTIDSDVYFSWQHFPRVVDTVGQTLTIAYFNNDNSQIQNGTNGTTGLYLSVDQEKRHVSLLQKLEVASDPVFADSQGDTQTLPDGHSLMGYGQLPLIREYDASGTSIYQAQFGNFSVAAGSYRAYKYLWTGTPSTLPKVVAESSGHNGITVYVSWNGATEVESWKIYIGPSSRYLPYSVSVPKEGFETKYQLQEWGYYGQGQGGSHRGGPGRGHGEGHGERYGAAYVRVDAIGSDGQVLASSAVTKVVS